MYNTEKRKSMKTRKSVEGILPSKANNYSVTRFFTKLFEMIKVYSGTPWLCGAFKVELIRNDFTLCMVPCSLICSETCICIASDNDIQVSVRHALLIGHTNGGYWAANHGL